MECKHELNCEVSLIWVPSHVGIRGIADEIADNHTHRLQIDIHLSREISEMYSTIENYCRNRWQTEWSQQSVREHYRGIVPNIVHTRPPMKFPNRRMQVTANRLQLAKCRLNHYLHTMGKHDTGLCDM